MFFSVRCWVLRCLCFFIVSQVFWDPFRLRSYLFNFPLRRGALIIRRLCVLLDAERVYRELSTILEGESDLNFASIMVQVSLLTYYLDSDKWGEIVSNSYDLLSIIYWRNLSKNILEKLRIMQLASGQFHTVSQCSKKRLSICLFLNFRP